MNSVDSLAIVTDPTTAAIVQAAPVVGALVLTLVVQVLKRLLAMLPIPVDVSGPVLTMLLGILGSRVAGLSAVEGVAMAGGAMGLFKVVHGARAAGGFR